MKIVLCVFACMACDQATLVATPDAQGVDACVVRAVPFCDATAPLEGCSGGDASDPNVALLPTDATFPIGCVANVISADRDPVTGECKLAAVCKCEGDDAGDAAPSWTCSP